MDERRDDWKNGVDKKLVDLTSAQRSTDDELDDLGLKYGSLDRILRGDPENDISGFQERLHNVENGLQELRAEKVKFKVADTAIQGFKWNFWTVFLSAIIPSLIALAFQWRSISGYLEKQEAKDPLERSIERAKHKKGAPIIQYRIIPPDSEE